MPEAGEQLVEEAAGRIDAVERAVAGAPRPRVAALEWLDPVFVGGHWVPQMIELAGGEDVLGLPGEKSRTAGLGRGGGRAARGGGRRCPAATTPSGLPPRPCATRERLAPLGARVAAVDAAAYFSRPGPRLVDGIELLAHLLHPELVPAPPARRSIEVDTGRPLSAAG